MSVRRLVVVPTLALTAGLLTLLWGGPAQAVIDRDCGDFATQKAAQVFFLQNSPSTDPHRLDADGDGIACDANPCPCYLGSPVPNGSPPSVVPVVSGGATRTVVRYARVTHVVDGDTVDVRLSSGGAQRVRLLGIDTPEVYNGVECGGPAASAAMRRMLPVGTRVRLVSDTTQARSDRYGRALRYVTRLRDGVQVNRRQVWLGHATVYVYRGVPFLRLAGYRRAEAAARAVPRGLWKSCQAPTVTGAPR
jgi:endonuclease YncB( thermonuclease family)